MTKLVILFSGIFLFISAFVPHDRTKSGIHGIIDPSSQHVKKIWAIHGADSVSTVPVPENFSMELKPGHWKLVVEVATPYKNTVIENITVQQGQSTDAGVIKLSAE